MDKSWLGTLDEELVMGSLLVSKKIKIEIVGSLCMWTEKSKRVLLLGCKVEYTNSNCSQYKLWVILISQAKELIEHYPD